MVIGHWPISPSLLVKMQRRVGRLEVVTAEDVDKVIVVKLTVLPPEAGPKFSNWWYFEVWTM